MIRRVISEVDDVGNNDGMPAGGIPISAADAVYQNHDVSGVSAQIPSPSGEHHMMNSDASQEQQEQPSVVADDQQMDETDSSPPVYHIPKAGSSNSSLSDVSTEHNDDQEMADAWSSGDKADADSPQALDDQVGTSYHNQATLNRSDSKTSNDSSSGSMRASSQNSSRDWGWFEEIHYSTDGMLSPPDSKRNKANSNETNGKAKPTRGRLVPHPSADRFDPILPVSLDNEAAAMAVTAPTYVLEESLSSQRLWKDTAGQRPPQPVEERAFYEKMWAQNFARSQVNYQMPVEVLTATSPISLSPFADGNSYNGRSPQISDYNLVQVVPTKNNKGTDVAEATLVSRMNDPDGAQRSHQHPEVMVNRKVKGTDGEEDLIILVRGDNVFGTTVSKSFARSNEKGGTIPPVVTVNISVASYRVVESSKLGKYAQFLVIYREGSFHDTVGVWKRYSDFVELSRKVTQSHEGCANVIANMSPLAVTDESEFEHLPNAITSWRLLKKRQRWYRCLDAGYLSLKVFLLERFLHDILFESSSPKLLREFVGAETILP